MPAPARGEILFRAGALLAERAERIGRDLSREEGKTLAEGIGETRRAAAILRYFAGQTSEPIGEVYASATPGTRLFTQRGPVGVVAAITPWNFPIAIPAWKIAPALAYGNTVLFKPAGATPLTAHHLVTALVDAGLPPGVLSLVFADGAVRPGRMGRDAAPWMRSASPGRRRSGGGSRRPPVASTPRVQLELGGKNAVIVAPDADIARAADIDRARRDGLGRPEVHRHQPRHRHRRRRWSRCAPRSWSGSRRSGPGDPIDPATTLGPVIDGAARDRVAGDGRGRGGGRGARRGPARRCRRSVRSTRPRCSTG